ncbi:choice-of-anchor A family protein [Lacipirellula limnantheis]|uniref:PEP-CTERM motif protein n=1 Tax=Lacipirellula limnantheis TaxID=2528024 RepID=A0A517U604_9BACT|nr:choice-of-anchor A family protein [Lacipirellula limnantheis]QDT76066.1 PEP-CTERM motif protein [Lacipirellula limnantheis]
MRLSYLCAMAAAIVLTFGLSVDARAANLGAANAFNGFIFGNLTSAGQDTEGRLAVGGNFTASNYGVGSGGIGPAVPITNPRTDVLVVGGDMNAQGGWQVFNGNAVWGTSLTAAPTTPSGVTYQGNPVNFAAAQADLTAKSTAWGALSTNASVVFDGFSTLTLTATSAGLNVFNVSESVWESTSNKQIVNAFPMATLLINILGTNVTQFGGMSYNGSSSPSAAHGGVLFNYPQATVVQTNNIAMLGSVLAPYAALTINGGGINGVGVAASAHQQNGGEFHNFTFTGDIPVVPEPTSLALAGLGLAAIAVKRRRA